MNLWQRFVIWRELRKVQQAPTADAIRDAAETLARRVSILRLCHAMAAEDALCRAVLVRAIGYTRPRPHEIWMRIRWLSDMLNDESAMVREAAADAMSTTEDWRFADVLDETIPYEGNACVRQAMVEAREELCR